MKIFQLALITALVLSPQMTAANAIRNACLKADRGSRSQCSCIQSIADRTLNNSQQRKGATFFANPQRAQDTRQSDRRADTEMWEAWKNFGQTAAAICS